LRGELETVAVLLHLRMDFKKTNLFPGFALCDSGEIFTKGKYCRNLVTDSTKHIFSHFSSNCLVPPQINGWASLKQLDTNFFFQLELRQFHF